MFQDEGLRGQDGETGLATRAAWLSYIGGLTQEEIATRLGVSRVKVNRLIAQAHKRGLVRVFIEGDDAACVALEDRLAKHFALRSCTVVPRVDADDAELPLMSLGTAGARHLHHLLDRGAAGLIGVGHGRTLAAAIDRLPRLPRAHCRFVSLLGSLTRKATADPFDVIHRLVERTGGEGYFMPVPFFADDVKARAVLMAQQSVRDAFALAKRADVVVIGVGEVGPNARSLVTGMLTAPEMLGLERVGAVGEILGHYLDAEGQAVECDVNARSIGVELDDLRGREVVAIAGGRSKAAAIAAALRSGVVTSLITDEATASRIADAERSRAVAPAAE